MPNPIKYSTGSESDALVKGNFRIGTGSVGKGPSDTTGYYQAVSPPNGGYVIYLNNPNSTSDMSYHIANNDSELISFTNGLAGQSYTTTQECFDYYYGQTDKVLINQDYPADYPYIVMDGLVLNLDAGITQSYSGSGTVWTDINGLGPKNNGTLINGPTFSSADGGSIVFDGTNDYINLPTNSVGNWSSISICMFVKVNSTQNSGWNAYLGSYTTSSSRNLFLGIDDSKQKHWVEIDTSTGNYGFEGSDVIYNQWYQSCLVYDGSALYEYKNGVVQPTTTSASGTLNTNSQLRIGTFYNNTSLLTGQVGTLQIYNRALSSTEVLQNYNAQKGRFGL